MMLCTRCEALGRELNTSAKNMNGAELAAFRKKLQRKYGVTFENGWTVRMCRRVSDVFTVESVQCWKHTKKGVFGKTSEKQNQHLMLRTEAAPGLCIKCIVSDAEPLTADMQVHVNGALELVVFLPAGRLEWKSAEFLKRVKIVKA